MSEASSLDGRRAPMDTGTPLTPMVKVEAVVDGRDVPGIRDVILEAGATGFTSVSNVSGFGHHGAHQGSLLFNDRESLTMLITVVPEERAGAVIAGVRRFLDERHGVLFVSETNVSRPEYFT
ncbi:MAG: transcriptional regulator [Actinomycetota bacterium]